MADNYVEILVKSRDQAKPELDDLKAKLDDLSRQTAEARAEVDDEAAAAKLDMLDAKLIDLGKKVANPRISMSGAVRAEAQLHAIQDQLDHLGDSSGSSDEAPEAVEKLDRALKDEAKKAGDEGNETGKSFSKRFGEWFESNKLKLMMGGLATALATLPALGAVGAAGMVVAIGAKVADGIPSVAKQFTALGTEATKTLRTAVQPMIPALTGALKILGTAIQQLGPFFSQAFAAAAPAIKPLANALIGLVSGILPGLITLLKAAQPAIAAFGAFIADMGNGVGAAFSALAPAVKASSTLFGGIGTVLVGILPAVSSLASALAKGLVPVFGAVSKAFVALAPSLGELSGVFSKLAGSVVTTLASVLTTVLGVVQAIAPSFGVLAKALGTVFAALQKSGIFAVLEHAIVSLAGPLAQIITVLVSGLAPILAQIIPVVAQVATVVAGALLSAVVSMLPGIVQLVQILLQFLGQVVTPLLPALTQLSMSLIKILVALTPLLPPLLQLVDVGVKLLTMVLLKMVPIIVQLAGQFSKFADIVAKVVGMFAQIEAAGITWIANLGHIKEAVRDLWSWIKEYWGMLAALLIDPIGVAIKYITTYWDKITSGAQSMYHGVLNWFKKLPGDILSAVSDLPGKLYNFGAHIISMLASGIKSAVGTVTHAISSIGGEILDHIPHSPAKKGPLSGSGDPTLSGRKIAQMLATGITAGTSSVTAAANRMAGAAGIATGPGTALHPAGTGGATLQLEWIGSGGSGQLERALLTWIKENVRARGGAGPTSVQRAFGQVA